MERAHEIEGHAGFADQVARLLHGLGKLVTDHLALARLELGEDARRIASVAVFVPLVVIGYAFLNGALAALAARWLTPAGALAAVGAANLVAGAVGVRAAITKLKRTERRA